MYSIIDRMRHVIVAAALSVLVCACQDDIPSDSSESMPGSGNALRFTVDGGAASRMENSGVSSTFSEDDAVGCVIAFRNADGKFDYQATTSWRYRRGVLVLDRIYTLSGDMCDSHDAGNSSDLICRHPGYRTDDGYVMLNTPDKEYCFFFYYPFITGEEIDATFDELIKSGGSAYQFKIPFSGFELESDPKKWSYQNKKNLMLAGLPGAETKYVTDGNYWNNNLEQHPHFEWTKYPCFASIAQGSKEQLNNSNFMWVRYVTDRKDPSKPITKEDETTHYTVGLSFRKKFAAIDLIIDDPGIETTEGSLYYRNTPEDANYYYSGSYQNYFFIGKRIDLSTGTFTEYPQIRQQGQARNFCKEPEYAALYASCLCDSYEDNQKNAHYNRIRPGRLDNGAYRMILPPQNKFMCELHFRKNGVEHVIDLYSKLPSLLENTLYTIRLADTDQWEITIRDWHEGDKMLIEEDK